jgi:YggT family protein
LALDPDFRQDDGEGVIGTPRVRQSGDPSFRWGDDVEGDTSASDSAGVLVLPPLPYISIIPAETHALIALLQIVQLLLNLVWWVIVIQAVLSWLIAFNVINTQSDFVRTVWNALQKITEPLYRPIRRILPDFGALDLSPLVVLLILYILTNIVIPNIAQNYLVAAY